MSGISSSAVMAVACTDLCIGRSWSSFVRITMYSNSRDCKSFPWNSSSSRCLRCIGADPSWREVLRLITGRIADRFAGEVIRFLARDAYQPWPQQFGYRPPRNIALAVQCLGEIHGPNAIRREAAELLRVIIELLEHSIGTQDTSRDALLQEELVPAIQTVGIAWPGRELYEQWYQQVGASLRRYRSRTSPLRLPAYCSPTATVCMKCWIDSPVPATTTGNAPPQ